MIDAIDKLITLSEKLDKQFPIEKRLVDDDDPEYFECYTCDGDGAIHGSVFYTNLAAGIQVFGIGQDLEDIEEWVELCDPKTILALCRALKESVEGFQRIHSPGDSDVDISPNEIAYETEEKIQQILSEI